VERFVRDGGGLIAADLGWSWTYYDKQPIETLPINALGRRLGFAFTADNLGHPSRVDAEALPGLAPLVQTDWVPSGIRLDGEQARVTVRDDQLRAMAGTVHAGRGRVAVFGHSAMLRDNPALLIRSVGFAAAHEGR
jgi:hypothetical protein